MRTRKSTDEFGILPVTRRAPKWVSVAISGDSMTKKTFEKGDVVRLSELGKTKIKKPDRQGRVLSVSPTGSQVKVQWDGLATHYMIHASYLERHESGGPSRVIANGPTSPDTPP